MRILAIVRTLGLPFLLLPTAWVHAAPPAPPQAVRVDIVFVKAKSDGTGIDQRIETKLAKVLRDSSKGGPSAVLPYDRFDSYEWLSRGSRNLGMNESTLFPVPLANSVNMYVEYRGEKDAVNPADGPLHAITLGTQSKSGQIKNKVEVKLADGGTFLQGLSLRAGDVIAAVTVTGVR